ncbi:MAG TPA: hypothetical protein VEJ84_24000 [Acidimicrobiales bacterium]|nr:hypothetical protein [Acidimicrobiales bacterium]
MQLTFLSGITTDDQIECYVLCEPADLMSDAHRLLWETVLLVIFQTPLSFRRLWKSK